MAHDAPHEATATEPVSAFAPADDTVAWWIPSWYVLFCALPLAGAFFLPVPLIMVMRSYRPPVDFTTAAWLGVATGWVLWTVALVAWFVAGFMFKSADNDAQSQMAQWWRRTTQLWIFVVLAWGAIATIGIWVFYAVVGHAVGLDTLN